MIQLDLFTAIRTAPHTNRQPYKLFDVTTARTTIIQQLLRAKGDWVRRMALRRATGMRPHEVGEILDELKHAGLIEFSDSMDIHHPLHGFMGQTRGYRIPRTDQEAA